MKAMLSRARVESQRVHFPQLAGLGVFLRLRRISRKRTTRQPVDTTQLAAGEIHLSYRPAGWGQPSVAGPVTFRGRKPGA